MPVNQATALLMFANLQMAAEATRLGEVMEGTLSLAEALTTGNNRSSKFTLGQAAQFVQEWKVLDHKPNTGTGFSGTLFEYIGTNTDLNLGPVNGRRVVSLRSMEFVDDAVGDSVATNGLGLDLLIGQAGDDPLVGDANGVVKAEKMERGISIPKPAESCSANDAHIAEAA